MRSTLILLLVGCLFLSAGPEVRAAQDEAEITDTVLESEELVVLLARVKKQLDRTNDSGLRNLLRLDYYITVYGQSPQLEFLATFDMHRSPVPAPTGPTEHMEMMRSLRLNTVYPGALPLGSNPVAGWAWRALR